MNLISIISIIFIHFSLIFIDFDAHGSGAKFILNRKLSFFRHLTPFCATFRWMDFENFLKNFFFSVILYQKKIFPDIIFFVFVKKIGEKKACFATSKICYSSSFSHRINMGFSSTPQIGKIEPVHHLK